MTAWDRYHWDGGADEFLDGDDLAPTPGKVALTQRIRPLQRLGDGGDDDDPAAVHAVADHGLAGPSHPLPYLAQIQASFGPEHDVSHVRAHTGGAAAEAADAIRATAFARGDQVAFGGAPSLHTAAHEAAHVVQQRSGVHLAGGVGRAGDPYEQHADAVADRVVRGESASDLLRPYAGRVTGGNAVQREPSWWPFRKAGGIIVSPGGPVQVPDNRPRPKLHAGEYLKKWGARHAEDLPRLLDEVTFPSPSPYLTWTGGSAKGFGWDLGQELQRKAGGDPEAAFKATIAPANVWEVVNKARDAEAIDHPEQADEFHESVTLALVNVYREVITQSLTRLAPRYVNEWNRNTLEKQAEMSKRNNGADIPEHPENAHPGVGIRQSHPIDYHVLAAIDVIGRSRFTPDFAKYRKDFPSETKITERRERLPIKTIQWQHDKGASNWIKIADPLHATAEDVAAELYGDERLAYKITAAPPLFGLEPMGLKPEYYKELHSHGKGTSPELRPDGGPHMLPQQILGGPLADEVALDQARGFKKDKLPPGGLDQYFDQLIVHFNKIEPMAAKTLDGADTVIAARKRIEQRKQKAGTDDAGQAELWGAQAREQLDVVVKCYEGIGKIDRTYEATAKQPIGGFEAKLLHDKIARIYLRAASTSDMVVTARAMVDDAERQIKTYVVEWLDEVFRWLKGALINSRFNKRTGNAQDPKLGVHDLELKEAEIQRDLHKLRDTLLNRPDDVDKEVTAAYQKLSDMSVEVSLIRDIDACDAAWKQLKDGKSTMGWIRGLVPGDHGNEKLENLMAEANGFEVTWNQILEDWREGRRDAALTAMNDEHNKAKWKSFFERVAREVRDQAELDRIMTFAAMIGIAVLSGGVGQIVGAAVGGGLLGFAIGLGTEVTVFTALSYAVAAKEHTVEGFAAEWKKNLGVFLLLRAVSAPFSAYAAKTGANVAFAEVLTQYAAINGLALWEANNAKNAAGRGSLSITEILEISLENMMFMVGVTIGGALVQPWVSKLALRGKIGARIREVDSLHERVVKLADRVQATKGKDPAAAHELTLKQRELVEKELKIVEELSVYADNEGAAKDAGISDAQLAQIKAQRGDVASARRQLSMVKLLSSLEPVSSGSYLIARDGAIEGARKEFEAQKSDKEAPAEPGEHPVEGVEKVGAMVTDPKSGTRSFDVTLRDGTTIKVSERAGKTEEAVPEGSEPAATPDGGEVAGEIGTQGRNVYRIPFNEAAKKGKAGGVDPKRILAAIARMVGMELFHGAEFAAKKGNPNTFTITIPNKDPGKPPIELTVKVDVRSPDDPMWSGGADKPHGGDTGPVRGKLINGDKPVLEITVNSGMRTEELLPPVRHELNEATDILHNNPRASEADIKRESGGGGVFQNVPGKDVISHNRSQAGELKDLYQELVHAKEAHKPDPDAIADAQAKVDRMLRTMFLDRGALTPEQRATLEQAGVPDSLLLDVSAGGPANRRAANFGRNVSDVRGAQPTMSINGGATKPEHGRSKHWENEADRAKVLDILNNPEKVYTGTYEGSGRHVDVYAAKESVVITEPGQKDVMITSYGKLFESGKPVDPLKWSTDPNYRMIK